MMNFKHFRRSKNEPIAFEFGDDSFAEGAQDNCEELNGENASVDVFILDAKQQFRYDIFKSMYADILYRWELLIQRSEVAKTIRAKTPLNNTGSALYSNTENLQYSDLFRVQFRRRGPEDDMLVSTSPVSRTLYQSPSVIEWSSSSQVFENFIGSRSSLPRSSEPSMSKHPLLIPQNSLVQSSSGNATPPVPRDVRSKKKREPQCSLPEIDDYRSAVEDSDAMMPEHYCVICRREVRLCHFEGVILNR